MKRTYVNETLGDMKTMYEAYNEAMLELVKQNSDIVLVYSDYAKGSAGEFLQKEYPDRIYDVGIAEANLITSAAGLAAAGKIPFAVGHSMFAVGRAYNEIRQNVAYDNFNVKIVLCNSGMLWGFLGGSHQIIEEIAALRVVPNMILVSPADPVETKKATKAAVEHLGPVAIRLSATAVPTIYKDSEPFELGKAVTVIDGEDTTIIATGIMLEESLKAAETLAREGINVRLIDMHTIKPIDKEAVIQAAKETGAIVTVEDSSIIGGLGGAVAEIIVESALVPIQRIGIKDRFGQTATPEELKEVYEISANHIVKTVREVISRKK